MIKPIIRTTPGSLFKILAECKKCKRESDFIKMYEELTKSEHDIICFRNADGDTDLPKELKSIIEAIEKALD